MWWPAKKCKIYYGPAQFVFVYYTVQYVLTIYMWLSGAKWLVRMLYTLNRVYV